LEISVREERVPSAISSIRGSRGTPGRELYGTGAKSDKDEKSVNETQISIGKLPAGKRDYLLGNSVYSGKFPVEPEPKRAGAERD